MNCFLIFKFLANFYHHSTSKFTTCSLKLYANTEHAFYDQSNIFDECHSIFYKHLKNNIFSLQTTLVYTKDS